MHQVPGTSGERNTSPLIRFYLVIVCIVIADQLSKLTALSSLSRYETLPIIENFFHLTLVMNTGVAFGMFREHPGVLVGLITLSLLVLFIWAHTSKHLTGIYRWAMALILGGALGNWIDRMRLGAVVDFLDFRVWPVFNLADCGISIGVGLYILALLRDARKGKTQST